MKIHYYKELDSTQNFLCESLKRDSFSSPVAVVAETQSAGFGSRGNKWISEKGNLFVSFAVEKNSLPDDLKLESTSIYFSYILKEILKEKGSKIWLKWPNDFYLQDKKVGGTITTVVGSNIICGIGLNLSSAQENFISCDITIDRVKLLKSYFAKLAENLSWKQVFSNYKIEFNRSKNFSTHYNDEKITLSETTLNEDGSLMYNNERIYSLR